MLLTDQPAVRILALCNGSVLSVAEIVGTAGGNHEKVIKTLDDLRSAGLVQIRTEKRKKKGRPRRLVITTPLGQQFLAQYERLLNLPLKSKESDIKKALHQAELAQRLMDHGISTYARFQELNEIARNIGRTSQAK